MNLVRILYTDNVWPYIWPGILVQRRAGCDLLAYLTPRLLKPLGIRRTVWEVDPFGNTFGAGGLFLTVSELHKLGLLYLAGRLLERQAASLQRVDPGKYQKTGRK